MARIRSLAPGILLCLLIALPSWLLGGWFAIVGAPVFAILFGMAIALILRGRPLGRLQAGVKFTSKTVLQCAVVLLGFGLNLGQIAQVGAQSLPVIIATISVALVVAYLLSRAMGIPGKTATLIGVGSSICGGSAIAATAPVVKADDQEVAQSISVIFLFNVVAALVFPTLGGALGLTDAGFGLFAGTAVNDTSSVTAAAAAWDGLHPGAHTLDSATIVKLTRTLAIIPITLVLALWTARSEARGAQAAGGALGGFSLRRAVPTFVILFVLASVAATALSLPAEAVHPLKDASKLFITMAMAAIGLNTDLVKLVRSGGKPIALGFVCWAAITATSLGMQHILGMW